VSDGVIRFAGPVEPRRRLVCLPHAGGSAGVFRPWRHLLRPDSDLAILQLPGRANRYHERPLDTIAEVVADLSPRLAHLDNLPYALFGHSLGGLIAYELARRAPADRPPTCLIVAAARPPSCRAGTRYHELPDREFLEIVRREQGVSGGVPAPPELLALLLPALRADFRLGELYAHEPGPPPACPIAAYAGRDDTAVPVEKVRGWEGFTPGGFRLRLFDGDHFFVHAPGAAIPRVLEVDLDSPPRP